MRVCAIFHWSARIGRSAGACRRVQFVQRRRITRTEVAVHDIRWKVKDAKGNQQAASVIKEAKVLREPQS